MDFHAIREALGLTIGSLIAFVLGVACVGCAVATGLMYTATTLLDWQAVQIWRIERRWSPSPPFSPAFY